MNIYHDERGRFCSPLGSAALRQMSTDDQKSYMKAISEEPQITKSLQEHGAKLVGLDRRIKAPQSTLEKLYREGKTVAQLYDIVRYTHIDDAEHLVEDTKNILDSLKAEGNVVIKFQNTWKDENASYKGINVKMSSPTGQHYELQFHTQESFDLKNNELHKLYEEARRLPPGHPYRQDLERQMMKLSSRLEVPKGVENL